MPELICYGDKIIIPQGYWRPSNTSLVILKCNNKFSNCIGDYPDNQMKNLIDEFKLEIPESFCYEGNNKKEN